MAKKDAKSAGPRIVNKRARHEFHVTETVECGIALLGTEVKALREGNAQIADAHVRVIDGEAFLIGATIGAYSQAAPGLQHDPTRDRKLLLHRRQIAQIEMHVRQKGKTVVPLAVYFHRGWAKCELGIVEGKRQYDKRQAIKKRDQQREIQRAMRRGRR